MRHKMAVTTKSDKDWSFQELNDLITEYEKCPCLYNLHLVIIKTARKRKPACLQVLQGVGVSFETPG